MGDDLFGDHSLLDHVFSIPQHSLSDITVLEAPQLRARAPQLAKRRCLVEEHYS